LDGVAPSTMPMTDRGQMANSLEAQTRTLIRQRSWSALAAQLVEAAAAGDEGSENDELAPAEAIVCELLAHGTLEGVRAALEGRDDLPLIVRILSVDAATRMARCSPEDVQALFTEVTRDGGPELRLWMSAVSADFSLWQGDLNGVAIAQAALIGAEEQNRGPLYAIARGRLRRLLGLAALVGGVAMRRLSEEMMAAALTDFESAGCTEEQVVTRGLFATVNVLVEGDVDGVRIPQIRAALDGLRELGSDRIVLGQLALGWTSGVNFDFRTVAECLEAIDADDADAVWPILRHFVSVLRAILELHANGPEPAALETLVREFRALQTSVVAGPTAALYVAAVLLDAGAVDTAEQIMAIAGPHDPMLDSVSTLIRREVEVRIELQRRPGPEAMAAIEALTQERIDRGQLRFAGEFLLRCAWDCVRLDRHDDAERLRAQGEQLLPVDLLRLEREGDDANEFGPYRGPSIPNAEPSAVERPRRRFPWRRSAQP
jgi:hypothetical protein